MWNNSLISITLSIEYPESIASKNNHLSLVVLTSFFTLSSSENIEAKDKNFSVLSVNPLSIYFAMPLTHSPIFILIFSPSDANTLLIISSVFPSKSNLSIILCPPWSILSKYKKSICSSLRLFIIICCKVDLPAPLQPTKTVIPGLISIDDFLYNFRVS